MRDTGFKIQGSRLAGAITVRFALSYYFVSSQARFGYSVIQLFGYCPRALVKPVCLLLLLALAVPAFAQAPERHDMRRGNKLYDKEEYSKAEIAYRHGLEKDSASYGARFNLADALYKQNGFEEAEQLFQSLTSRDVDSLEKAALFHNLANSRLQQQKIQESIDAYKQSLRLNPTDEETRANLAYAQLLLQKEQQQQQNQQQNQDQNQQEQNQENNNQDNNNGDQQDQQDNQDQQEQGEDKQDNNQNNQQQEQKISPQDAQRILEAVQAKEKETQDKVKKEKAKLMGRQKIEKNW